MLALRCELLWRLSICFAEEYLPGNRVHNLQLAINGCADMFCRRSLLLTAHSLQILEKLCGKPRRTKEGVLLPPKLHGTHWSALRNSRETFEDDLARLQSNDMLLEVTFHSLMPQLIHHPCAASGESSQALCRGDDAN